MKSFLLALLLFCPALTMGAPLDIYWIDVEGGATTLLVTPGGETVLMDAGWAGFDGRDANNIKKVLSEVAKKDKIDYFLTSHFHLDHVGGVPALAAVVPITKFVDHGDSVEQANERGKKLWDAYLAVAQGKRMQVKPGDKLPVKGVDFTIVAARSKFLAQPLVDQGPNPLCADVASKPLDEGENGKSVGFVVSMGKFDFLDLGDLSWNFENEAACPKNLFGEIDLYQVTHHGMNMSGAPAHIGAIKPKVAVMNNGPRKGGSAETFETLKKQKSLQDLWQVHRAVQVEDSTNANDLFIANMGETEGCQAHWIKASVEADGSYTVTNSRNNFSKKYQAE
jgi:beta-lactamase superfamily II metal-dependent hydrolase